MHRLCSEGIVISKNNSFAWYIQHGLFSFNARFGARVAMKLRDSRNDLVNSRRNEKEEQKSE